MARKKQQIFRQLSNKEIREVAEKLDLDPNALIADVRNVESDGFRYENVQDLEDDVTMKKFQWQADMLADVIQERSADPDDPGGYLEFDESGGETSVKFKGSVYGICMGLAHAIYTLSTSMGEDVDVLGEAIMYCADDYADDCEESAKHNPNGPEYMGPIELKGDKQPKKAVKKKDEIPEGIDKDLWD